MNDITLKHNEALETIASRAKIASWLVADQILQSVIGLEILYGEPPECNNKLVSLINESDYSVEFICMDALNYYYPDLEKLFNDLIVWGEADDCPECGCYGEEWDCEDIISTFYDYDSPRENEVIGLRKKCINCNEIF